MRDIERLANSVQMLVNGWREHIDYSVEIAGQIEQRGRMVRHEALLVQLHQAASYRRSGGTGSGSTNKPESRAPGNEAALYLIDTITEEAQYDYHHLCTVVNGKAPTLVRKRPVTQTLHNLVVVAMSTDDYPISVHEVARNAKMWVRKSMVMLGYEKPHVLLKDTVCGTCGGALVVASDASTDVRCIGINDELSCGQVYPRWTWLDLLQGGTHDGA